MTKLAAALVLCFAVSATLAERPTEKREDADIVLTGRVSAVYARDTLGYRDYIIEVKVDEVTRGRG